MIAPLRPAGMPSSDARRRLADARRAVARSLLPAVPDRPPVRAVPAWRAWLLVLWMALVAVFYVARMMGYWD